MNQNKINLAVIQLYRALGGGCTNAQHPKPGTD